MRGKFEGIANVIRFNWHFYLLAAIFILLSAISPIYLPSQYWAYAVSLSLLILVTTLCSVVVTYYVYDRSSLY